MYVSGMNLSNGHCGPDGCTGAAASIDHGYELLTLRFQSLIDVATCFLSRCVQLSNFYHHCVRVSGISMRDWSFTHGAILR
jgi:hypothetical protein